MDYDVGDWVVCIENEGYEDRWTVGWKYLCKWIGPAIFKDGSTGLGARMFGVSMGASAESFRKYNPPAPELIQRHTERPKVATE